jgi:hypothetical protein
VLTIAQRKTHFLSDMLYLRASSLSSHYKCIYAMICGLCYSSYAVLLLIAQSVQLAQMCL